LCNGDIAVFNSSNTFYWERAWQNNWSFFRYPALVVVSARQMIAGIAVAACVVGKNALTGIVLVMRKNAMYCVYAVSVIYVSYGQRQSLQTMNLVSQTCFDRVTQGSRTDDVSEMVRPDLYFAL